MANLSSYKRVLNKMGQIIMKPIKFLAGKVKQDIEFKRERAKPSQEMLEYYKRIRSGK